MHLNNPFRLLVIPSLIGVTLICDLLLHREGTYPLVVSLFGILGALFISFGFLRLWASSSEPLVDAMHACVLPLFITPICGFFIPDHLVYASVNILVVFGVVLVQFSVLSKRLALPVWVAVTFTAITFSFWWVSQQILFQYADYPAPMANEKVPVITDAPYNNEQNRFVSGNLKWSIGGETEEITEKKYDRTYTVLKMLLEDALNAYINNTKGDFSYYKLHPMLQRFRNTNAGAKKWDSIGVTASFRIEHIYARKDLGRIEYTVSGKQKLEPSEKSAVPSATIRPFSYTLTLYRTQTNTWELYYARNNKISQ